MGRRELGCCVGSLDEPSAFCAASTAALDAPSGESKNRCHLVHVLAGGQRASSVLHRDWTYGIKVVLSSICSEGFLPDPATVGEGGCP